MNSVILEEGDLARVLERLKKLEESQKKSVESVLKDLQHLIRSPLFQKDQAIDYLVNLKIVAKETKHNLWHNKLRIKRYASLSVSDTMWLIIFLWLNFIGRV